MKNKIKKLIINLLSLLLFYILSGCSIYFLRNPIID
jgi:hypothetical protein